MKIYMLDGGSIEIPCEGLADKMAHHCIFFSSNTCSMQECRHWRSKDWLCKCMNE